MDTYCWIHSTFSIPSRVKGLEGRDIAHAGVAPNSDLEEGQQVRITSRCSFHKKIRLKAHFDTYINNTCKRIKLMHL